MNILKLNHEDAKDFFLTEENYCSIELPKYFKFSDLLKTVSEKLSTRNLTDYYSESGVRPESFEDVNYKILNNKKEYAWRLLQLIHPALYVALVHEMTKEENWKLIVERFKRFQQGVVECVSLPVIKSEKDKSGKATQILTWWEKVEQKSLALSLEYEYLFHTDIVDCYGSIYTHSIAWALHTKEEAKKSENRNNQNFHGNVIDKKLREMQNGQTNGIPQGSVLMDFIAEIVLGYTDQKLSDKLEGIPKEEYKIIRYRDDYRVFVNNLETGKEIIKQLTNVLSEMGMRLNTEKTKYSDDVIVGSIKPDKLFWIAHGNIKRNLEKNLLMIYDLSKKYSNSGVLIRELTSFYKKIEKRGKLKNSDVLIGISVNIAFRNPRTYPVVSAILSKLLELSENSAEIMNKIKKRFTKLPNTEYLDLWLQRITLKIEGNFSYQGRLCKKVENNNIEIWCSDWLKDDFKEIISSGVIIDQEEIEKMKPVIESKEFATFEQNNYY